MELVKDKKEYEIQGYYSDGWEMVTTEETYLDAVIQLRLYDENEPDAYHRIREVPCEEDNDL